MGTVLSVSYNEDRDVTEVVIQHEDGACHDYEIPGKATFPRKGARVEIEDAPQRSRN